MIIKKKRIISVDKYINNIKSCDEIYVRVLADEKKLELLNIDTGQNEVRVVPPIVGPVTRFNVYGKQIVRKDMEKEIRHIERDYHVVDWHGTDHYGTCIQDKMCYPKEYVFPPLVKLNLYDKKIISDKISINDTEQLKNTINVFVEIFGYCELIDKDSNSIGEKVKIQEVTWEILPKGKYPWERAENVLEKYFETAPEKNKHILKNNHRTFAEYEPDFLAIGENSFNGYVVYGFTKQKLYIFESNQLGNATYVFKGEWENASQLTKYDIIKGNLCYQRIIHTKKWNEVVGELFRENE